jgi:hypothetical protein
MPHRLPGRGPAMTRIVCHISVDIRLHFGYLYRCESNLAHREGRQPGDSGWRSECGARGRRLVTAAPGRLWASCLPALGPACEVLAATGAGAGRDNPAAYRCLPREAWPKLSRWDA